VFHSFFAKILIGFAICNSWCKLNPPFSFLSERKENGPFTVQKKRAFLEPGGKLWTGRSETRSPNRLASASNPAAAAAVFAGQGLGAYF
jgi:hypothetical protein